MLLLFNATHTSDLNIKINIKKEVKHEERFKKKRKEVERRRNLRDMPQAI